MDLWSEIESTLAKLDLALDLTKKRGEEWAQAKADYYTAKAEAALQMRKDGVPVTLIEIAVKGDKAVNRAMLEMDIAEVGYDNAREARNVYKKKLDTLREQYDREWSRAGMTY